MVKRVLVVFVAMVWLIGAAGAETLSPQAFTAAFAAAVVKAMPSAKVTVTGDLRTDSANAKGETTTSDLRNAYNVYLAHPQDLDSILTKYAGLLVDILQQTGGTPPPVDRARIVPVIKTRRWLDGVRQELTAPEKQPLTEPYNSELIIVFAEDRPSSIRYLNGLDDVGDRSKLHDLALGNLHRLLAKIEMRQGADGIFLIEAGGDYEASLLLADNIWSSGQFQVNGDIVAAVPAKNALFVTGSRNRAGLKKLRAVAAEIAAAPYGLTPDLFVYRDGKFKVFGRSERDR
jgi:uncharacterized protein YtpQ (UPF0354 family)